jgi:hypothetical protein
LESKANTNPDTDTVAIGTVFKEHILAQLRDVLKVAEGDLPEHFDQFRELLAEIVARTDACELTQRTDRAQAYSQPTSPASCSVFTTPRGEPVSEFLLIPFGDVNVERPVVGGNFVFTRRHAESAKDWFDRMGRTLAIDYEHQSFDRYNTRPDGLRPAAGWIGKVQIRDDGLWAVDVTWTARARELLRSGEYRYFSPVIYWTDEDYTDVAALGPVALTNDPAMRGVRPLAASRRLACADIDETRRDSELREVQSVPSSDLVPRAELETLEAEVTVLRKQLTAQEADTFVERGMHLGKILDSTSMDWREDYLRDPERAEERLARAPVLLPPGRIIKVDRHGEPESASGARDEFRRNAEIYRRWGIEPEDLIAYEQAFAANRVRYFGMDK